MELVNFSEQYRGITAQNGLSKHQRLDNLSGVLKTRLFNPADQTPDRQGFIDRKWSVIRGQACQNAGLGSWGVHLLRLDDDQVQRVQEAFDRVIAGVAWRGFDPYHGQAELSSLQQVVRHLLQDLIEPFSLSEHLTREHIHSVLVEESPELMAQVGAEIQSVFVRIHTQIQQGLFDPKIAEMVVGHLIALYAYMSPQGGSQVRLLQKIGEEWRLVDYNVERLQLTNGAITSPVYAFGLTPADDPDASPLLLFHGTAPPGTSGAVLCYMADLTPYFSVGEWIFNSGKGVIDDWMGRQNPDKKPQVYGTSLGGSLSYHAGRAYGDRVDVHSFVPAGLFPWTGGMERIAGTTYCHEGDPVSLLGIHPDNPNFRFIRVVTDQERGLLAAHVRGIGYNPTLLLNSVSRYENARLIRTFMTVLQQLCGPPIFALMATYLLLKFLLVSLAQAIQAAFACATARCLPQRAAAEPA